MLARPRLSQEVAAHIQEAHDNGTEGSSDDDDGGLAEIEGQIRCRSQEVQDEAQGANDNNRGYHHQKIEVPSNADGERK